MKILTDSQQALLFDNGKRRHVLVEVGDSIGDYLVAAIADSAVTLKGKTVPVEIELASPDAKPPAKQPDAKQPDEKPPADTKPAAKAAPAKDAAPENPYEPSRPAEEAPGPKSAPGPEQSSRAGGAPSDPYADAAHDDEVAATGWEDPAEPPRTREPAQLAKQDVSAALRDFPVLVGSIDGTFIPQGLKLDKVRAGSIFAKAGLLAGDVVVAVDGQPMRSLDDAAELYARAGGMQHSTVQILRAGKPQTLRVAIQ